jgi:hypothetical protein
MGKHGAELSKSFARGMSRRASRKRFVTGLAGGFWRASCPAAPRRSLRQHHASAVRSAVRRASPRTP